MKSRKTASRSSSSSEQEGRILLHQPGLIHVDGDSAIKGYDYASTHIADVAIETAGTLDMDVELKFRAGDTSFSIDVKKSHIEQLKDIYKALISIGRQRVLDATASMHKLNAVPAGGVAGQFGELLAAVNEAMLETHTKRDFSDVFSKYIHN